MNDPFQLEIEDARALIEEMRGNPNAYCFHRQKASASSAGNPDRCYTVIVELGAQRMLYQGGQGLDWVAQLEFDLCRRAIARRSVMKDTIR